MLLCCCRCRCASSTRASTVRAFAGIHACSARKLFPPNFPLKRTLKHCALSFDALAAYSSNETALPHDVNHRLTPSNIMFLSPIPPPPPPLFLLYEQRSPDSCGASSNRSSDSAERLLFVDVCVRGAWRGSAAAAASAAATSSHALGFIFEVILIGHACDVDPKFNKGELDHSLAPAVVRQELLAAFLCSRRCGAAVLSASIPSKSPIASLLASTCKVVSVLSLPTADFTTPHTVPINLAPSSSLAPHDSAAQFHSYFLPHIPSFLPSHPPRLHNFPLLSLPRPSNAQSSIPQTHHTIAHGKIVICVPTPGQYALPLALPHAHLNCAMPSSASLIWRQCTRKRFI
jgi:hypothetical protein